MLGHRLDSIDPLACDRFGAPSFGGFEGKPTGKNAFRVGGGSNLKKTHPTNSRGTFPILSRDPDLSRKPPEIRGNRIWFSERTMVEKTGKGISSVNATGRPQTRNNGAA